MPVKRRVSKQREHQITPHAIALFRKLRRKQPGSEAWWQLHNALFDELATKPWDWPIVEDPDLPLHPSKQPDLEARQRWRELERAAAMQLAA